MKKENNIRKEFYDKFNQYLTIGGEGKSILYMEMEEWVVAKLSSLLQETVEKIEGKKKLKLRGRKPKEMDNAWIEDTKDGGYNQAISEASNLIKEKLNQLSTPLTSMK